MVFLFFAYLYIQSGNQELGWDMIHHEHYDVPMILEIAKQYGIIHEDDSMKELLGQWLLANFRKEKSGIYGYNGYMLHDESLAQGPFFTLRRSSAFLDPGGALYFKMKPGNDFNTTPQDGIAYMGYNSGTQAITMEANQSCDGDIMIVYNYSAENGKQVIIPSEAQLLTD